MEQQSDFYNDNNFNTNNLFQNEILSNPIISHPSTPTTNNSQNSTSPQSTTNHLIQQINNSSSHLSETGNINSTTPPITINSNINFSSQDVFDMSQNQLDPAMIASPFTDHEHHQLQQQIHVQSQLPSSDTHPIVPSQRSIDQQHLQRKLDEEHERVAAAAQQVMAQQMAHQYAMLQHQHMNQQQQQVQQQQVQQQQAQQQLIQQQQTSQSHEAPHVVLSQIPANMTTNSTPTTPTVNSMNPLHQIQPENMSLHNALLQQQQYINEQTTGIKRSNTDNTATLAKKKSRRHTVSSSHPPALNIDTKNLNPSMAPRSAAVPSYHKTETVKPTLGAISLPPRPTPQELGLTLESKAKDYANMTKEQLIARLIVLETEKLGTEKSEKMSDDEEEEDDEEDSPNTPTDHKLDEDKSTVDDDDEEEESVAEEEASASTAKPPAATTETPAVTQITCKWKDCGQVFDELQKLITHINDNHVGSGKPTYSCEWEGCPRNQKPFTKRHKMYNHLRTHTGERPFVCDKPGCGKRFSRPDSLTTHIKTHSNVRPFICLAKGCGKAYYHSRSLKKHEKIHENQTNYISSNSAPTTVGIPHPQMISVDYLSSQLQHQSPISIHGSESVPTSPHPALQQQQQQQNFAMLNHQQAKPYTPLVLSYPAGLEHNGEHIMAQQQQQLYDSVNQQQQQQQMSQQMSQQQQMPQQQQQPMLQQQQQQQGFEYRQA